MANVTGRLTINGVEYLEVDASPGGGGGTVAPAGSLATVSGGSGVYIKNSATDADWTQLSAGLSGSGTANKVAYWSGTGTLTYDTDLHYISANNYLGIGTTPSYTLHLARSGIPELMIQNTSTPGSSGGRITFASQDETQEKFRARIIADETTDGYVNLGFKVNDVGSSTYSMFIDLEKVVVGDIRSFVQDNLTYKFTATAGQTVPELGIVRYEPLQTSMTSGTSIGRLNFATQTNSALRRTASITATASDNWGSGTVDTGTYLRIDLQDNTTTAAYGDGSGFYFSKDKLPITGAALGGNTYLYMISDGYSGLIIEADAQNGGGEPTPYIQMLSDGTAVSYYLGGVSSNNDSAVGTISGAHQNALFVGTTSAYKLQLGTNSTVVMDMDASGIISSNQTPVAWAALSVSSGSVTSIEDVNIGTVSTSTIDMTVNFSTARPNINYAVFISSDNGTGTAGQYFSSSNGTGSFLVHWSNFSGTLQNWSGYTGTLYIAVFDLVVIS